MNRSIRVAQQDVVVKIADQSRANPIRSFRDKVVQGRPTFRVDVEHGGDCQAIGLADLFRELDERVELGFRGWRVDRPQLRPHVAQQLIELLAAESAA